MEEGGTSDGCFRFMQAEGLPRELKEAGERGVISLQNIVQVRDGVGSAIFIRRFRWWYGTIDTVKLNDFRRIYLRYIRYRMVPFSYLRNRPGRRRLSLLSL